MPPTPSPESLADALAEQIYCLHSYNAATGQTVAAVRDATSKTELRSMILAMLTTALVERDKQIAELQNLLAHCREDAGPDSCADLAVQLIEERRQKATLASQLSGVCGALADAGNVPASREDGDYAASVRQVVEERDELRRQKAELAARWRERDDGMYGQIWSLAASELEGP